MYSNGIHTKNYQGGITIKKSDKTVRKFNIQNHETVSFRTYIPHGQRGELEGTGTTARVRVTSKEQVHVRGSGVEAVVATELHFTSRKDRAASGAR